MNRLEIISQIESLLTQLKQAQGDGDQRPATPPTTPPKAPEPTPAGNPAIMTMEALTERGALVGNGAIRLGLTVDTTGTDKYKLVALFTNEFGSWDGRGGDYDMPQWARDAYLGKMPMCGGDHHMYALVLDKEGRPVANKPIEYSDRSGNGETKPTNDRGFTEFAFFTSFVPERGEHGPWSMRPRDGERVNGIGMPSKRHVSVIGVWKES